MSKIKVAFAQIDFKPALIYNQIDLLVEPSGDETTTISQLTFPGSTELKNNLKEGYFNWIKLKILAIVKKAIDIGINILVFPEYSIPAEILNELAVKLNDTKLIIIAGTHIVKNTLSNPPKNYPDTKSIIGCAMCPIITYKGVSGYTLKTHRAAQEINSICTPKHPIPNIFDMGDFDMQIKICIDAITVDQDLKFTDRKGLIVIPSYSQNVEPFKALAILAKYNEIPVIYANCASAGGSIISGAFSKYGNHWFTEGTTTKPVIKDIECMVSVNLNLDNTAQLVGTVNTEEIINVDRVINIFYNMDEKHKTIIQLIDEYLAKFPNMDILNIPDMGNSLLGLKLHFLHIQKDNGLISKASVEETLDYIKINSISFSQFVVDQSNSAFNYLSSNIAYSKTDNEFLKNLGAIIKKISPQDSQDEGIFEDDNLFYGRDNDVASLSDFFNNENNVYLIYGLRGLGKTKLIKNISTKVLPSPSPWILKKMEISKGIGYDYLLDQFMYMLNLPDIERKDKSLETIVCEIFDILENQVPTSIIIEDIHHCTQFNGEFFDTKIREFMIWLIRNVQKSKKVKLIMTSNRRIGDFDQLIYNPIDISRLKDGDVRSIINYCYRKINNTTKVIEINDNIINIIYGNPLAAILVSQLIDNDKLQEFGTKSDIFLRYKEQLIKNLLGEIELSDEEKLVMKILSVSKTPVEIDFIEKNYSYLIPTIDALVNRLLIEKDETYIKMHPLFQEYYYDSLTLKDRSDHHKKLATYYEKIYLKQRAKKVNPLLLSNIVFHYAGSLKLDKVHEYKAKYIDELGPIADRLYKDKNYQDAVNYYRLIFDTIGKQRTDVLIKMAKCYVCCSEIDNAEKFFKLAIMQNPRGAYLWAQFAIALACKNNYLSKAKEYSDEAERIYRKYGNTLRWELAKIKFAQARAWRFDNPEKAAILFDEAVTLDPTNCYYLCMYATYLFHMSDSPKAKSIFDKANDINPDDPHVIRLKLKFGVDECDEKELINEEYDEETDDDVNFAG